VVEKQETRKEAYAKGTRRRTEAAAAAAAAEEKVVGTAAAAAAAAAEEEAATSRPTASQLLNDGNDGDGASWRRRYSPRRSRRMAHAAAASEVLPPDEVPHGNCVYVRQKEKEHGRQKQKCTRAQLIGTVVHVPADGTCFWHCVAAVLFACGRAQDMDGYALREQFVAWLDEGEGAERACEALDCYSREGGLLDAMLVGQAVVGVSKGERQSVFAEVVDKAYCVALQQVEATLQEEALAGADVRGDALFRFVEEKATRAAMCLLSEMTKTPFESGDVQYFLYPESFHFGARYWPLRVRRFELTKDKGHEQEYLADTQLCVGDDAKAFAVGWALLLVETADGPHYDLIRLASDNYS
jgi:hypothetical protein